MCRVASRDCAQGDRPTVQQCIAAYMYNQYTDVVVLSGRIRMQRPRNRFHTYTHKLVSVFLYVCVRMCVQFSSVYLYRYICTRGHYIGIYIYITSTTCVVNRSFRFVNEYFSSYPLYSYRYKPCFA